VRQTASQVLVVDDDAELRELLVEQIRSTGFTAEGAADPESALRWIGEQGTPRLIILDINLGPRNGLDLLALMRHIPHLRSIPVFVCTASRYDTPPGGAQRVFHKPIDIAALTAAMTEVVG
jgi:CheY-like chemotaxis protein